MLENILSLVTGNQSAGGQSPQGQAEGGEAQGGLGKLLPLIFVFIIVAYGLKLLKPKEEEPVE